MIVLILAKEKHFGEFFIIKEVKFLMQSEISDWEFRLQTINALYFQLFLLVEKADGIRFLQEFITNSRRKSS